MRHSNVMNSFTIPVCMSAMNHKVQILLNLLKSSVSLTDEIFLPKKRHSQDHLLPVFRIWVMCAFHSFITTIFVLICLRLYFVLALFL